MLQTLTLITNVTHSFPWNEFLAQDPGRTWPVLHNVMAMVLGGKHRWNEMLFHDAARLYLLARETPEYAGYVLERSFI